MDLSCVIELNQGYLLGCDSEGNFFSDPKSLSSCLELLDTFRGSALQFDYSPWESNDVYGYDEIQIELEKW